MYKKFRYIKTFKQNSCHLCSLRDQIATCPNCRVEISKSTASRNLAVEKAASELPSECQVGRMNFQIYFAIINI